jgi:thiamine biosynthesis lipoprotein
VTVIARTGTEADALATAVSVLGPRRGIELVEATPGAAARIAREGPAGVERSQSSRWKERAGMHAATQ